MTDRVEKPWGYELIWAKTERYVGKVLHIEAGHALSLQYHRVKDETIRVSSGRLKLEVEEPGGPRRAIEMAPGDAYHLKPGTIHRMTALETTDVVEVSTIGDSPVTVMFSVTAPTSIRRSMRSFWSTPRWMFDTVTVLNPLSSAVTE